MILNLFRQPKTELRNQINLFFELNKAESVA